MGMDIRQANCPSRHLGVLGGQQLQNIRKLSDWHQLWWFIITSADSCGNGRRLNTSRPSISQGALGVWGHKFKSLGKLSNGCTGWHRIWYTSADSSGNGYRLNTIRPTIPQGHFGGGVWVTNSNVWGSCQTAGPIGTKFGTNLYHSGNGHRLNTIRLSISQGAFCGFQGVTAVPIGTKFGTHVQNHLGMDIRQTNCPSRHKEAIGGFRGSQIQMSVEAVKLLDRLTPNLVHVCGFVWEWT